MDPNRYSKETLEKLPIARLLSCYKKERGKLMSMDDPSEYGRGWLTPEQYNLDIVRYSDQKEKVSMIKGILDTREHYDGK